MMMINIEKLEALKDYLKNLKMIITKPTLIDFRFAGIYDNYMEYRSKVDRYEIYHLKNVLM